MHRFKCVEELSWNVLSINLDQDFIEKIVKILLQKGRFSFLSVKLFLHQTKRTLTLFDEIFNEKLEKGGRIVAICPNRWNYSMKIVFNASNEL